MFFLTTSHFATENEKKTKRIKCTNHGENKQTFQLESHILKQFFSYEVLIHNHQILILPTNMEKITTKHNSQSDYANKTFNGSKKNTKMDQAKQKTSNIK